jgi:hypothetical protein
LSVSSGSGIWLIFSFIEINTLKACERIFPMETDFSPLLRWLAKKCFPTPLFHELCD